MSMPTICRKAFVWFCFKVVSSVVIFILIIFIVRDAIINNLNIVFELFFDTPFCNVPSIYRPVGYCSFAERFGVFSYPSGSTKVISSNCTRNRIQRIIRINHRYFNRKCTRRNHTENIPYINDIAKQISLNVNCTVINKSVPAF